MGVSPFVATVLLAALLAAPQVFAADTQPAMGKLLIADRDLRDPNFVETVVLLVHYNETGTVGLVINRPTDIRPAEALPSVEGLDHYEGKIYAGGPVAFHNILVLVRAVETPDDARTVFGDVHISGARTLLDEAARSSSGTSNLRLYAGHAGWAPGQLEQEIARGSWHLMQAREDLVFTEQPGEIWQKLLPPEPPILAYRAGADSLAGTLAVGR